MKFTIISDMYTNGYTKTGYDCIILECSIDKASAVFYKRFNLNLNMSSCNCCGDDFSSRRIDTKPELMKELTQLTNVNFLTVTKKEIKQLEKKHPNMYKDEIPEMGYIYVDGKGEIR